MDYSFNRATLARRLTATDFYNNPSLTDETYRRKFIEEVVITADQDFSNKLSLSSHEVKGKATYSVRDLTHKLILRQCAYNITKKVRPKLKTRSQIIRELRVFLSDGGSYTVYRLDIQTFFETCDAENILKVLTNLGVNQQTIRIISQFLSNFNNNYSHGIPRGVEISSILSEVILHEFDEAIRANEYVFYYSRFVDDIIIVTSSQEEEKPFIRLLKSHLPKGLRFNHNKSRYFKASTVTDYPAVPVEFDYLGYRISITEHYNYISTNGTKPSKKKITTSHTNDFRDVVIDISNKKTKSLIGKLHKAFYSYAKSADFALLSDRINFLATNRDLIHKGKNEKIPTGIYYNYKEISVTNGALSRLDKALKALVLSPNKRLENVTSRKLNRVQTQSLLKISFQHGFSMRVFKKYSPNRLKEITRIW